MAALRPHKGMRITASLPTVTPAQAGVQSGGEDGFRAPARGRTFAGKTDWALYFHGVNQRVSTRSKLGSSNVGETVYRR